VSRRRGLISAAVLTGTDWQSLRNALVGGNYWPGIDLMSSGASTVGVSPDFGTIKRVMTSTSQSIADDDGVFTNGLLPGHSYTGIQVDVALTQTVSSLTVGLNNSQLRGDATAPTSTKGYIRAATTNGCRYELRDCTVGPARTPNAFWVGIQGGYRVKEWRCDYFGTVDHRESFPPIATGGIAIESETYQGYFHDYTWWNSSFPGTSSDGSHNDGDQIQGGDGRKIWYCNFENYNDPAYPNTFYGDGLANPCILIVPDVGNITGLDIQFNRFEAGGVASVHINHDRGGTPRVIQRALGNIGTIKNNLFIVDTSRTGFELDRPTDVPITGTDFGSVALGTHNYRSDNGAEITYSVAT
jgi:hypothetical protein